jgi:hypothetical protein
LNTAAYQVSPQTLHAKPLRTIENKVISGNPESSQHSSKDHINMAILFIFPKRRNIMHIHDFNIKIHSNNNIIPEFCCNHTIKEQMLT